MEGVPNEERSTLDSKWFEKYSECSISVYEMLDGESEHRKQEKTSFLKGEKQNPELDYPKLADFNFKVFESKLLELKQDILNEEHNQVVREIYRTKINETLAKLRMLIMTKEGQDRKFARYSKFVYGTPTKENTEEMSALIKKNIQAGNEYMADDLLSILAQVGVGEQIDDLDVSSQRVYTGRVESVDEVAESFEEALSDIDADDWSVVKLENESITNFRVSQKDKEVSIPSSASGMFKKSIMALIQHEIYGHVQRRVEGERSRLQLFGLGLDRVEKGEEGVATYLEQQVRGATQYSHPQRYLAIALATGDIDGQPKDFREIFELMKQYYLATLAPTGDLNVHAEDKAWTLAVRVFRGTSGSTPGAVFTKDMNYFVGNKETWALVNNQEGVVEYFKCGKFDMANTQHVGWLTELGILDEELQKLINKIELGNEELSISD